MTERFEMQIGIAKFTDTSTEKEYSEYNIEEIVDLLNEQDNEIKRLKQLLEKQQ